MKPPLTSTIGLVRVAGRVIVKIEVVHEDGETVTTAHLSGEEAERMGFALHRAGLAAQADNGH